MEEKIITRQLFCLNLVVNCFYVLNEKIIFATNEVEINNIYTINVFKHNRKKNPFIDVYQNKMNIAQLLIRQRKSKPY